MSILTQKTTKIIGFSSILAIFAGNAMTRAVAASLKLPTATTPSHHGDWTTSHATGRLWGSSAPNPAVDAFVSSFFVLLL